MVMLMSDKLFRIRQSLIKEQEMIKLIASELKIEVQQQV